MVKQMMAAQNTSGELRDDRNVLSRTFRRSPEADEETGACSLDKRWLSPSELSAGWSYVPETMGREW